MLQGGDLNVVVQIGDTVRRPVGPWSFAVHALLRHFEAVGFDGAPRFLGIDDEGREILSYVEGDAAFAPVPPGDGAIVVLWDLATPGSRLADIGSAASYWAPLRIYDEAEEWGLPTDRRGERLRLLCDAYGLEAGHRADLLDNFMERRRLGYEAHRVWGGIERRPGWAEMWDGGSGQRILGNIAWVDQHRQELDRWLR
jgi:hypothetical protein